MIDPNRLEAVDDDIAAILREMTSVERSAIADRMWSSAVKTMHAMLRSEHSDWSEEQIRAETYRRIRGTVQTA